VEDFAYSDGDTGLIGRLFRPASHPRAAVVVFPTIMNIAPNAIRRGQMLADAGYLALVADLYGTAAADRAEASRMGERLREDWVGYRSRIAAAIHALSGHPDPGTLPMAAIGYCMGGQAALEAARMNLAVVAAVSFHGLLSTDMPATAPIRPRILVCHGDADPLATREQVAGFQAEMDRAGANWHLHVYSGVKHGFTDPQSDSHGLPALGYDASADRQSWASMLSLFDEVF